MPIPENTQLPLLELTDLKTSRQVHAVVRIGYQVILCAFVYEGDGDIEVAFDLEDCRHILEVLHRALESCVGEPEKIWKTLTHKFKNLDEGKDAAFIFVAKHQSIDVTVDRSDEGGLEFLLSLEDARRLAERFEDALGDWLG